MYCSVIDGCREAYALRRAREWTAALTAVVRAAARHGRRSPAVAWSTAPRSCSCTARGATRCARRARARALRPRREPGAAGEAHYRQAELQRLRGEFARAEEAYREASRCGHEPQPGLALLRLAQGDADAAAAAIRRAAAEAAEPARARARCCPRTSRSCSPSGMPKRRAAPAASSSSSPPGFESGLLDAMVAQPAGAVELAAGDAGGALGRAAPSLAARGRSWRAVRGGARAGARRRSPAARSATRTRPRSSSRRPATCSPRWGRRRTSPAWTRWPAAPRRDDTHGLTPRELQVLRLVAAGADEQGDRRTRSSSASGRWTGT